MLTHECKTCKHWDSQDYAEEMGQCRRHAPMLVNTSGHHFMAQWPITIDKAWCGDWEEKAECEQQSQAS